MKRVIKLKSKDLKYSEQYEAYKNNRLVGLVTLYSGRLCCIYFPYGKYYKKEEVLKEHLFDNSNKSSFTDANERHVWLGEFRNLLHERNEANIKRLEEIRLKRLNRNNKAKRSQVKYTLARLSQAQQSYIQSQQSEAKYSNV